MKKMLPSYLLEKDVLSKSKVEHRETNLEETYANAIGHGSNQYHLHMPDFEDSLHTPNWDLYYIGGR